MIETIKLSLANSFAWTKYFNRRDYAAAFRKYCWQYGEAYRELSQREEIGDLAEAMLVLMEERREKKLFPWKKKAAKTDDKMLLLTFVTPMLLSLGDEGKVLAEALRDAWQDLYGDETYELADYETIAAGFNNSVMGFSLFGEK